MLLPPASTPPPDGPPHQELVVPRHDVQWCRPVFKAPSLTMPQPWQGEVPFGAAFPVKRFPAEASPRVRT